MTQTENHAKRYTPAEQARALAVVLQEEFGVPLAFYETATGTLVWFEDLEGLRETTAELRPEEVLNLAKDGRAHVHAAVNGRYQFQLPLSDCGKIHLIATGAFSVLATEARTAQEQQRLQRWVQSVGDRLRSAEQLASLRATTEEKGDQVKQAWEVTFSLDHLLRHLRLHKDPARNQQRILQVAHELLPVQSLLWVPAEPEAAVIIHGPACLASADCRQLAHQLARSVDGKPNGPVVFNRLQEQSWAAGFSQIVNVLALPVTDQSASGWIIALNKHPGPRGAAQPGQFEDFRRSDAAVLTPFAGLMELHERGSRRYQDLKDLLVGLTRSLTSALDTKDSYTYGHSERVARIALELGREMKLNEDVLGDIYLAGLLHDVGKIGIRDSVLGKTEPLTPEEFEHIKQHVTMGFAILADLGQIQNLLPGVLYHHERYDGTGYPDGLVGEEIPLLARILAVADAYDAMSTTRPYRQAMPCRRVEEILQEGSGRQWDKNIVDAFLKCRHKIHAIRQRGVGESLRHALEGALRKDEVSTSLELRLFPRTQPGPFQSVSQ